MKIKFPEARETRGEWAGAQDHPHAMQNFRENQITNYPEDWPEYQPDYKNLDEASESIKHSRQLRETGESDQDYDTDIYDAICTYIQAETGKKATHREFDKYQGVYIDVEGKGKFWTTDFQVLGNRTTPVNPDAGAVLIGPDGEETSANQGDYFQLPKAHVFEGWVLRKGGQEIENPTVADLPQSTSGDFQINPSGEIAVTLQSERDGAEFELIVANGQVVSDNGLVEFFGGQTIVFSETTPEKMRQLGGTVDYDPKTGYCRPSMPGWDGPAMHPLAAYRVAKDYYASWDQFVADLGIVKMPRRLETQGKSITDAFYILFGGLGGLAEMNDVLYDRFVEDFAESAEGKSKRSTYFEDHYNEDDMIAFVWKSLFKTSNPPIEQVVAFIEKFGRKSDQLDFYDTSYAPVLEAAEDYLQRM